VRPVGRSPSRRSRARSLLPEREPDGNLFRLEQSPGADELFERLAGAGEVLVERIVSAGHSTEPGRWLEQERDEWVVLLDGEATLAFEDDAATLRLVSGDHVLIPAGVRHRVEATRAEPPCVWLALHAPGLAGPSGQG
jgi:cupin 2 domain-containing protein